jgi:hypothetical protein
VKMTLIILLPEIGAEGIQPLSDANMEENLF